MDTSKKLAAIIGGIGLIAGAAGSVALQTHAQSNSSVPAAASGKKMGWHMGANRPAAVGSVTAVSGNTITLNNQKNNTAYTVDASSATIQKFTAPSFTTITVSQIAVGDNLVVEGTASGTNITATKIVDGLMGRGRGFMRHGPMGAAGTVTAVNGNSITITGKNGQSYTISAGSAAVEKLDPASVSDIKVGDQIMAQGTTSGNTITATQIIDGAFGHKQ